MGAVFDGSAERGMQAIATVGPVGRWRGEMVPVASTFVADASAIAAPLGAEFPIERGDGEGLPTIFGSAGSFFHAAHPTVMLVTAQAPSCSSRFLSVENSAFEVSKILTLKYQANRTLSKQNGVSQVRRAKTYILNRAAFTKFIAKCPPVMKLLFS